MDIAFPYVTYKKASQVSSNIDLNTFFFQYPSSPQTILFSVYNLHSVFFSFFFFYRSTLNIFDSSYTFFSLFFQHLFMLTNPFNHTIFIHNLLRCVLRFLPNKLLVFLTQSMYIVPQISMQKMQNFLLL